MLFIISYLDKETDKNYSKLLYRFLLIIRPIDNTLKMVYATKSTEESEEVFEA